METIESSEQLRLDNIRTRIQRYEQWAGEDGFAPPPAAFNYLRDVSYLLAENEKMRKMLRDLVTGPHFDPDRYSWTSVHEWLVANDAEFAAERE